MSSAQLNLGASMSLVRAMRRMILVKAAALVVRVAKSSSSALVDMSREEDTAQVSVHVASRIQAMDSVLSHTMYPVFVP